MVSEYRLTERLEGGELAELYRGERDGGPVVVKLFHERTSVKGYAQLLADITNKLGAVHHPGISHTIDIGLVQRRLAIVREDSGRYTLGQVLQRLNTKEVVITSALALGMIIDLLDAVTEAHGAGVVHGAMTPGNVLVSHEGRPSVCDFGALAALNSVAALKKNFAARGRSAYRAPELQKGEEITMQCDVYSLGAMTYELLTLREAAGESAQVSTRREALPAPSRLDRRLNSRIDPIVMRALDPVPGRRYKTTAEFASTLREFLTASGGLPPREEQKRFVDQLFPHDVQLQPSTQVPFTERFTLASVEGADVDVEERSMVLTPRASFSGSIEEMPVVADAREAITGEVEAADVARRLGPGDERERSTDWHAPAGAMPASARSGPKESLNPDILKRMKVIEDFAQAAPAAEKPDDTNPNGERLKTEEVPKTVFPGRPKEPELATEPKVMAVATPAESQPIALEDSILTPDGKRRRMITEERNLQKAEKKRKAWLPLVFASAMAAIAFLLLGAWRWSAGESLPAYDAPPPSSRVRPMPPKRPQPPPQKIDATPKPPVVDNCYQPKKGAQLGYLSVASTRAVAVVIDNDTVCGSLSKIPVAAGQRKIVVIDPRTKEDYSAPTRIEAGKVTKLIPYFKSGPR